MKTQNWLHINENPEALTRDRRMEMISHVDLFKLKREIDDLYHKSHGEVDGCKMSCLESEIGINSQFGLVYRFGGYCINNCDRWHTISAVDDCELLEKAKEIFK